MPFTSTLSVDLNVQGLIQGGIIESSKNQPWTPSWLEEGTGLARFDNDNEDAQLTQGILDSQFDLTSNITLNSTISYYPDGEQRWGITESYILYKPLSASWRFRSRLGAFYPELSRENQFIGWNSPYTYQYSAINSWIAEEIRIFGIEMSFLRPSGSYQSPFSYNVKLGLFNNNDGAGTLLAWRGFSIHDRQTRIGEKIQFADYPSLSSGSLSRQPTFVRPFKESDERIGGYLGLNITYNHQHNLRMYYYDNNGNPEVSETNGQYAWHTKFYSIAWFSEIKHAHILMHWLSGNTLMGNDVVNNDFFSGYIMVSTFLEEPSQPNHQISLRYEIFEVNDNDAYADDINNSNGYAWVTSWRYNFSTNHSAGFEWLYIYTNNENQKQWQRSEDGYINQIQLNFQYFFRKGIFGIL